MHVLGLDVGGTKTICLLADGEGRIVASARGAGANLRAVGELELEKVLHATIEQTLAHRGTTPAAICLGIAGVDRAEDSAVVRSIMRRIGGHARVVVVNDAVVALQAGVGDGAGIVIVAGTGSIAYGRDGRGRAARAGGWGYVLGDEGSGYWMGRHALRAVVRQADGRGRPTSLTPRLLAHFDVRRPQDLIQKIYHQELRPSAVAALARYLQQAHDEGDEIATAILERGAGELAQAARAVATQLDMIDAAFAFVLAGGIFQGVPWLREQLSRLLSGIAPLSTTRLLEAEAALGAVQLALAEARGGAKLAKYESEG